MISMVTAEVRPFSCSWRWRRTRLRAAPRPSSRPELDRTPIRVDFPLPASNRQGHEVEASLREGCYKRVDRSPKGKNEQLRP